MILYKLEILDDTSKCSSARTTQLFIYYLTAWNCLLSRRLSILLYGKWINSTPSHSHISTVDGVAISECSVTAREAHGQESFCGSSLLKKKSAELIRPFSQILFNCISYKFSFANAVFFDCSRPFVHKVFSEVYRNTTNRLVTITFSNFICWFTHFRLFFKTKINKHMLTITEHALMMIFAVSLLTMLSSAVNKAIIDIKEQAKYVDIFFIILYNVNEQGTWSGNSFPLFDYFFNLCTIITVETMEVVAIIIEHIEEIHSLTFKVFLLSSLLVKLSFTVIIL